MLHTFLSVNNWHLFVIAGELSIMILWDSQPYLQLLQYTNGPGESFTRYWCQSWKEVASWISRQNPTFGYGLKTSSNWIKSLLSGTKNPLPRSESISFLQNFLLIGGSQKMMYTVLFILRGLLASPSEEAESLTFDLFAWSSVHAPPHDINKVSPPHSNNGKGQNFLHVAVTNAWLHIQWIYGQIGYSGQSLCGPNWGPI